MISKQQKPTNSEFHSKTNADEITKGIDISNKIAIVTGGYSGIGLETTRALVTAGAKVIIPAKRTDIACKNLEGIVPNEDIVGASKIYLTAVNGLGSDDVRLSKRKGLSSKRIRGFERNKIGPVDGSDHIGGNYAAAINFEANLLKILPENTNTDLSLFLDFANVWGVDYDSSLDDSNKIRSSTGVMANWMSPLGPITFVLSQNLSKASTDKTESFNFNLGTTF